MACVSLVCNPGKPAYILNILNHTEFFAYLDYFLASNWLIRSTSPWIAATQVVFLLLLALYHDTQVWLSGPQPMVSCFKSLVLRWIFPHANGVILGRALVRYPVSSWPAFKSDSSFFLTQGRGPVYIEELASRFYMLALPSHSLFHYLFRCWTSRCYLY